MKKNLIITLAAIIGLAIVAFGYYTISPLFINIKADDANPISSIPTATSTNTPISGVTKYLSAPVIGTSGHPASGTARIVEADGKRYIRYENFKTINGPDIYVYLSRDLDATEFVSLGRVRATEGNVNYEIPAGLIIDDYPYVLIWCKAFDVLFNSAKLL